MVPRPPRLRPDNLGKTLAFVATLLIGIAAGCLWNAVEAVEEKFGRGKPHSIEKQQ
jgi:hypothetical protein